jgi:nicotinamidase-related amidase
MRVAFLILDVQKAFFEIDADTAVSLRSAVKTINSAMAVFRKHELPILCVQHRNDSADLVPGRLGFDISDSLDIAAGDIRIVKTHGNVFRNTDCTACLRGLGVDTVVIAGFSAEQCVLSTCRGAEDEGLNPILLRGGLASEKPDRIRFVEEINEVVSLGALSALLDGCRLPLGD